MGRSKPWTAIGGITGDTTFSSLIHEKVPMSYAKIAFLVIAAFVVSAPRATPQQTSEPPRANAPAEAAATPVPSSETDETAELIAKANAAAAANANARAASMTTRTLTKLEASTAARKKASEFGFSAEVYNGNTLFCKHDAALGSRIPLVRCMSADEFEEYATQLKIARDSIRNNLQTQCYNVLMCGGINTGGKPGN